MVFVYLWNLVSICIYVKYFICFVGDVFDVKVFDIYGDVNVGKNLIDFLNFIIGEWVIFE